MLNRTTQLRGHKKCHFPGGAGAEHICLSCLFVPPKGNKFSCMTRQHIFQPRAFGGILQTQKSLLMRFLIPKAKAEHDLGSNYAPKYLPRQSLLQIRRTEKTHPLEEGEHDVLWQRLNVRCFVDGFGCGQMGYKRRNGTLCPRSHVPEHGMTVDLAGERAASIQRAQ